MRTHLVCLIVALSAVSSFAKDQTLNVSGPGGRTVEVTLKKCAESWQDLRRAGVFGVSQGANWRGDSLRIRDRGADVEVADRWVRDLVDLREASISNGRKLVGCRVDWIIDLAGGDGGEFYVARIGIRGRKAVCRAVMGEPGREPLAKVFESQFAGKPPGGGGR